MAKKPWHNVHKQEAVVAALWDFASDLQHRPKEGQVITAESDGTKVSSKHIGRAIGEIMSIFGYDIVEIQ